MRAGRLRHRVTIESRSSSLDAAGQQLRSWSTFGTVYAGIRPLSGREGVLAEAVQSAVTHEVTIRYLSGVNATMRVNFGGRYFAIHAVRNTDERNREMVLDCVEGLADG